MNTQATMLTEAVLGLGTAERQVGWAGKVLQRTLAVCVKAQRQEAGGKVSFAPWVRAVVLGRDKR